MVKRNRESFVKRQKEIKRKQKAEEKQARRQGKKDRGPEEENPMGETDQLEQGVDLAETDSEQVL